MSDKPFRAKDFEVIALLCRMFPQIDGSREDFQIAEDLAKKVKAQTLRQLDLILPLTDSPHIYLTLSKALMGLSVDMIYAAMFNHSEVGLGTESVSISTKYLNHLLDRHCSAALAQIYKHLRNAVESGEATKREQELFMGLEADLAKGRTAPEEEAPKGEATAKKSDAPHT